MAPSPFDRAMNNDPAGLNQIYHKLGNIEGKLDALTALMTGHELRDETRFASIDSQLEELQESKWFNNGRTSIISGAVSSAVTVAILWLKGH
jgi:hypothetical protein